MYIPSAAPSPESLVCGFAWQCVLVESISVWDLVPTWVNRYVAATSVLLSVKWRDNSTEQGLNEEAHVCSNFGTVRVHQCYHLLFPCAQLLMSTACRHGSCNIMQVRHSKKIIINNLEGDKHRRASLPADSPTLSLPCPSFVGSVFCHVCRAHHHMHCCTPHFHVTH